MSANNNKDPNSRTKEVFHLFALLNLIGYSYENREAGFSRERAMAARVLNKARVGERYSGIKRYMFSHHPWYFLNIILGSGKASQAFSTAFSDFKKEPAVKIALANASRSIDKKERRLIDVVKKEIGYLSKFLKIKTKIRVDAIYNPLSPYWSGYIIKGKNIFLVMGPGFFDNGNSAVRHELLHVFAKRFNIPTGLLSHSALELKRLYRSGYSTKAIIKEEYIVRGLNIIYGVRIRGEDIKRSVAVEAKEFPKIKEVVSFLEQKII